MSATDQPPSTMMLAPVISDEAGEARNTTTAPTSFGSPILPSGMLARVLRLKLGSDRAGAVPSVLMKVGATLLTLMPCGAHSEARQRVRWLIAALVMQ